jgi:hypothetical protein
MSAPVAAIELMRNVRDHNRDWKMVGADHVDGISMT